MAAGLGDPFTIYFAPDKSTEFFDSIQNEYYGIGAYVDALDGYFVLQSLIA
jgi:C-terminal processing protease CtpA/Prc